jgi:hypothetical protein
MSATAILAEALQLPSTATTDQVAQTLADHLSGAPRSGSVATGGTEGLANMVSSLATAMATVPANETPGDAFHRLAELRSRVESISLADAYSRQSESTPELWDDVRNVQPRGY